MSAAAPDPLQQKWACLACHSTWPFGKVMLRGGTGYRAPGNDQGLNCPNCRSMNIHPADGTASAGDYHGEKGTLQ